MNFLAHLYLSPDNPQIMIGNFVADHIRGNKFERYSEDFKKGIRLHRAIDSFTDSHEVVKISKRRLHERYGHYDGVIIDIFYDHFLAKNWHKYSQIPLFTYTNSIYKLLENNKINLPKKTQELLPYIIKYNWLYNYQYESSIKEVLIGMNKRTKGKSQMHLAIEDLKTNYTNYESDFQLFFNDLIEYSFATSKNLI